MYICVYVGAFVFVVSVLSKVNCHFDGAFELPFGSINCIYSLLGHPER